MKIEVGKQYFDDRGYKWKVVYKDDDCGYYPYLGHCGNETEWFNELGEPLYTCHVLRPSAVKREGWAVMWLGYTGHCYDKEPPKLCEGHDEDIKKTKEQVLDELRIWQEADPNSKYALVRLEWEETE